MAYVDNDKFYDALVEYKAQCDQALADEKEKPIVPRYIGECLLLIAKNLAKRYNFNGYSWREEMVGDAILDALLYLDKFDTVKYKKPFAYFTQNMFNAFVRRIEKEKKQSAIKGAMVREMPMEAFDLQGQDLDAGFMDSQQAYISMYSSFSDEYPRRKKKIVEKEKTAMEKFMGE